MAQPLGLCLDIMAMRAYARALAMTEGAKGVSDAPKAAWDLVAEVAISAVRERDGDGT